MRTEHRGPSDSDVDARRDEIAANVARRRERTSPDGEDNGTAGFDGEPAGY